MQLRARTRCPLRADNSHTSELRSVFSDVHAAGENVLTVFSLASEKLCEAFLTDFSLLVHHKIKPFGLPAGQDSQNKQPVIRHPADAGAQRDQMGVRRDLKPFCQKQTGC